MKRKAISNFASPTLINECRSFLKRWEPLCSPVDLHLELVKHVDMLHSAKEFKNSGWENYPSFKADCDGEHSMPLARLVWVLIGTIDSR